ncbi:MAG: hypothetical protein PHH93_11715, partial [Prolixibacteraceae bacterium]|nr:hypothetical protein [Prolixibacteraceae bacterium]
ARLIKSASRIWGYPDVQDINSFDPVLGLIIGALAEEMYNISGEIHNSDSRVIGKLLELLFSQNIFTHFPAHAVASAQPLQPKVKINDLYQFYYTKEVNDQAVSQGVTTKKEIYFTPALNCTVFNGEIKYLMAGKYLFGINGRLKEVIEETEPGTPVNNSKLSVGIRIDPLIDTIDCLSLFFSFKNLKAEDRFYNLLHNAVWKINGKTVDFRCGMGDNTSDADNALITLLKKESNISFRTVSFINDYYSKRFMTLEENNYTLKMFKGADIYFPSGYLKNTAGDYINGDILWIEAELEQPLSYEDINDLTVYLNCFPVLNRELHEYAHTVTRGTNVIPLITNDLFFDVKRVSDTRGIVYKPLITGESGSDGNSYIVRQGGVTRFDSRDARQSIKHLLDLVRDEAAAFAVKGTDLISYELKQLDQILTRLEQRVGTTGISDDLNSCLILESSSEYDKINVQFWTVAGEPANNIRPGSRLSVYRGVDIDDNSITLLTQTVGGRHKLSRDEMLNILRRSLLSKGRVVTREDIKALCFEIFGNQLQSSEIKKGVSMVHSQGKGMTRTLDIYLYLKDGSDAASYDIRHKTENLKTCLKRDSVNLLPYRIFIK